MTEKIYPEVPSAPVLYADSDKVLMSSANPKEAVVFYTDISDRVNKTLSESRIKEIETKRHELEMNLKHYKKILKRWKKLDNGLKYQVLLLLAVVQSLLLYWVLVHLQFH